MPVTQMTTQDFREKIFDFENDTEWNFSGPLPIIIDFYAEWCAPCKMLEPVMEALCEEYKDQIEIYKIDIDKEKSLVELFGLKSVPTILFIPIGTDPFMENGALPNYILKEIIEEQLLNNIAPSNEQ